MYPETSPSADKYDEITLNKRWRTRDSYDVEKFDQPDLISKGEKMNTTRLTKLVIAVCLILAAFFAVQIFQGNVSAAANTGASKSVGFGDLQRYEAQQSLNTANSASRYIGFGDLQRYEAQQSITTSDSAPRSIGFGDLQRFEAQQALNAVNSASRYVGFGDLRLFEYEQSLSK